MTPGKFKPFIELVKKIATVSFTTLSDVTCRSRAVYTYLWLQQFLPKHLMHCYKFEKFPNSYSHKIKFLVLNEQFLS